MSAVVLPANRVPEFAIVVPAGTTVAAPLGVDTSFLQAAVSEIRIRIPDGHVGLTGIRLLYADSQVIPVTAGTWITGNDDVIDLPIVGYPTGGDWSVQAYNLGQFSHTFFVLYLVNDQALFGPQPSAPVTSVPAVV